MSTWYGHPSKIRKICEWTGKEFIVDWKHRGQRFVNKAAMYAWRKSKNREKVLCPTCGKSFERYKRILHPRSGKPTQYCSNECSVRSEEKREKLQLWIRQNNPMKSPVSREKIRQSKLRRYGDPTYNNIPKHRQTMMRKYGVACPFFLPTCKSNGRRISKFQRKHYERIFQRHPDAELEKYLADVQRAVDIFIPSSKHVIECHGDYWHCNPLIYPPDYYSKLVHLTAKEIWKRDADKKALLESAGYSVEVIWENA